MASPRVPTMPETSSVRGSPAAHRFPAVMEQYVAVRHYTLCHNVLEVSETTPPKRVMPDRRRKAVKRGEKCLIFSSHSTSSQQAVPITSS
jgi:hypothetical protein